jgi:hypothetical protein
MNRDISVDDNENTMQESIFISTKNSFMTLQIFYVIGLLHN